MAGASARISPEDLIRRVRKRYLESPDFNGLHIHGRTVEEVRDAAVSLVNDGLVQVVSTADYLNPHIRPWPSRRTVHDQVRDLVALKRKDYGVCLYPTALGMKGVRLPRRFADRPFQRAMARGRGTLEPAYFSVDVLEQYRNDGRYVFHISDFGANMAINDEAFEDESEPERDKVFLNHIGFAYDLRDYEPDDESSPIIRRVVVFHSDLVTLTPEHQQRWRTYQVAEDELVPHPMWWNSQMGKWLDSVGPFDRLFIELHDINELAVQALGSPLFARADLPPALGWILRPSQKEWSDMVLMMDKMLSENLRHQFFDEMKVPSREADGSSIGSLRRLELFMLDRGINEAAARESLAALRRVRRERQAPAHLLIANLNDRSFIHRQVTLLRDVNDALVGIRKWLATDPMNDEWKSSYSGLGDYRF